MQHKEEQRTEYIHQLDTQLKLHELLVSNLKAMVDQARAAVEQQLKAPQIPLKVATTTCGLCAYAKQQLEHTACVDASQTIAACTWSDPVLLLT